MLQQSHLCGANTTKRLNIFSTQRLQNSRIFCERKRRSIFEWKVWSECKNGEGEWWETLKKNDCPLCIYQICSKLPILPATSLSWSKCKETVVCMWICEVIKNSNYDSFHSTAWCFNNMQISLWSLFHSHKKCLVWPTVLYIKKFMRMHNKETYMCIYMHVLTNMYTQNMRI